MADADGAEDALEFFERLANERKLVQTKLTDIHKALTEKFRKKHPPLTFEIGDKVWIRNLPKGEQKNFDKLSRLWQGPFEILGHEGGARYRIQAHDRVVSLHVDRLKPYRPALKGKSLPCGYYVEGEILPVDDSYVVQEILDHELRSRKGTRKKEMYWQVAWKGHSDVTWEPKSQFMGGVNDVWLEYNKKHHISVDMP